MKLKTPSTTEEILQRLNSSIKTYVAVRDKYLDNKEAYTLTSKETDYK